jgi:hypothetical protein
METLPVEITPATKSDRIRLRNAVVPRGTFEPITHELSDPSRFKGVSYVVEEVSRARLRN